MHWTRASMAGNTVGVTPEGKQSIRCDVQSDEGHAFAVAIGDEKSLPPGMYSFTVTLPGPVSADSSSAVPRERKYQLKEHGRFGIINSAAEFEILTCVP